MSCILLIFKNFTFTNYCIAFAHIIKRQQIAPRFDNFSHLCRRWSGTAHDRECEQTSFFSENLAHHWNEYKNTVHERLLPWLLTIESWQWIGCFFVFFFEEMWLVRGILFIHFLCLVSSARPFHEDFHIGLLA